MYTIEKTFKIPMGHRLSKHKGLCKNFHGHNFVIKVEVGSDILDSNDMVMDFSDIKKVVNHILEKFDHTMLLNKNDPMKDQFFVLDFRNWLFECDPTAEVLCKYFFDEISIALSAIRPYAKVLSVSIWENDDSKAKYTP